MAPVPQRDTNEFVVLSNHALQVVSPRAVEKRLTPAVNSPALPEPVFPQYPDLLAEVHPSDPADGAPPTRRRWTASQVLGHMHGWLVPYIKSRVLPGDFQPIISYLFTEWKC